MESNYFITTVSEQPESQIRQYIQIREKSDMRTIGYNMRAAKTVLEKITSYTSSLDNMC